MEGAEEGGDFGVGDEGLGVGDVFVVEDEAGFVGVEGPCFCVVCLGLFYVSDSEWDLDKEEGARGTWEFRLDVEEMDGCFCHCDGLVR